MNSSLYSASLRQFFVGCGENVSVAFIYAGMIITMALNIFASIVVYMMRAHNYLVSAFACAVGAFLQPVVWFLEGLLPVWFQEAFPVYCCFIKDFLLDFIKVLAPTLIFVLVLILILTAISTVVRDCPQLVFAAGIVYFLFSASGKSGAVPISSP